VDEAAGGCFISMMRFSLPVTPESDIARVATTLDQQLIQSSARGEKFLFSRLSKMMVKKTIVAHNSRLGETAFSYSGPLLLKEKYGNILVNDIHGFISNCPFGAVLTGFGNICFGRLTLDFNFLTEETSREKAMHLAGEIKYGLMQLLQDQ
jgi:hypothetical protein